MIYKTVSEIMPQTNNLLESFKRLDILRKYKSAPNRKWKNSPDQFLKGV